MKILGVNVGAVGVGNLRSGDRERYRTAWSYIAEHSGYITRLWNYAIASDARITRGDERPGYGAGDGGIQHITIREDVEGRPGPVVIGETTLEGPRTRLAQRSRRRPGVLVRPVADCIRSSPGKGVPVLGPVGEPTRGPGRELPVDRPSVQSRPCRSPVATHRGAATRDPDRLRRQRLGAGPKLLAPHLHDRVSPPVRPHQA